MDTVKKPTRNKNEDRPLIHKYAEVWLQEAVELMRPQFAAAGYEIPPVHLSVGFSSAGYRVNTKRVIWDVLPPQDGQRWNQPDLHIACAG